MSVLHLQGVGVRVVRTGGDEAEAAGGHLVNLRETKGVW